MNDFLVGIEALFKEAPATILLYGTNIVLALLVYIVGKWIITRLTGLMEKAMNARGVDTTIASFTKNITYYALLVMVVIAALGRLGVQTAGFVAIIGAAGLAIGFALQGSLSNFASGVMIILFRPFKIGDYVEAAGTSGVVSDISIFNTILKTPDNKTVIVSNSDVSGNTIVNFSTEPTRRVDITVGVSYTANIQKVKDALQAIADQDARLLVDKGVTIAVAELADSSVNLVFRVWVNTPDFWAVKFDLTEKIKVYFDEQGIEIPFPQMDIHLHKSD